MQGGVAVSLASRAPHRQVAGGGAGRLGEVWQQQGGSSAESI
jgi:hypothetical protein